jgi:2-aminoethylphosphonate dioxygenase
MDPMAHGLTPSQCAAYQRDGYVHLPALLAPDEVAALQKECARVQQDAALSDPRNLRAVTRRSTGGGMVVDRFDPVSDLSPLIEDPRLLGAAADAMGCPVRLFKDKLIFKNPGAFGYEPHQDYTVWSELPPPAEALLSVLVAIDPATAANGAVRFFPGLHHEHYCSSEVKNLFGAGSGLTPPEVLARAEGVIPELAAGDAVVFSSLTPHDSAPNHTRHTRRALFLTYSDAAYGDLRPAYYEQFRSHMIEDRTAAGETGWFYR